jgi:DNA anti-recombination protein RmuC
MKHIILVLTTLVALALWTAGCTQQEKTHIDTANLERSFASSDPAAKQQVERIVASLKSEDFASAGASLQSLAANLQLNDDQRQAINETLEQLQREIAKTAEKIRDSASTAVEELQKALPE